AGVDGTLRLLDASTGREMLTIFAHPHVVADAAFSHDGNQIASASYDHTVRIWDASPLTASDIHRDIRGRSQADGRGLLHRYGPRRYELTRQLELSRPERRIALSQIRRADVELNACPRLGPRDPHILAALPGVGLQGHGGEVGYIRRNAANRVCR